MSDIPSSDWSETDASNNATPPNGWPEGQNPSDVNNSARAGMGAVKRWFNWTIPKITAGTSTAYTLTYGVAPGALVDGMTHVVQFNAANGAAPTLNVNGLGALPLQFFCNGTWSAVLSGMIRANEVAAVTYNSGASAYRLEFLAGEVMLGTQTIAAAAAFDFQNVPSNVNHLRLEIECSVATNAALLGLRCYDSGGSLDSGSNYYTTYHTTTDAPSGPTAGQSSGATAIVLSGAVASSGNWGFTTQIKAMGIQAARYNKVFFNSQYLDSGGTSGFWVTGIGQRAPVSPGRITGLRVFDRNAGNITGVATLWGSP